MTNHEFFQAQIARCDRAEVRLTDELLALREAGRPAEPCFAWYRYNDKCRELRDFRRGAREERQYWERRVTENNNCLAVAMVGG